jgi:hypothetical protein
MYLFQYVNVYKGANFSYLRVVQNGGIGVGGGVGGVGGVGGAGVGGGVGLHEWRSVCVYI